MRRVPALMRDSRGMAFVSVMIIMLFLLPLVGIFLNRAITQNSLNTKERQLKTARVLSNNVFVDFMRQFSQDYYDGHYDSVALARPEVFYDVGFSTVSVTADADNHSLYVRAVGKYGANASSPKFIKTLTGVIKFSSDLTQFGTMINGPFTISASNITYAGGLWFNGALTVTGANVTFNGGPVISNGNHTGAGSTVHNCDVYYLGNCNGGTYNGATYNYTPTINWPTINTTYYGQHYNYRTTATQTWQFSVVGGVGQFTIVGVGTVVPIPATGAILFAENCNLTIRGTVRGRVIIVASGAAGSATQGNVTVNDDLVYANGTNAASSQDSIAVFAQNRITFTKLNSNLTVNGIFFVQSGTSGITLTGTNGFDFNLYGVRCSGISITGFGGAGGSVTLTYDPNLAKYPPPGLPEKPILVTWRVR